MVETIFSKWSFIPLKSLKDFAEHRQVKLYRMSWVHLKIHYTDFLTIDKISNKASIYYKLMISTGGHPYNVQ